MPFSLRSCHGSKPVDDTFSLFSCPTVITREGWPFSLLSLLLSCKSGRRGWPYSGQRHPVRYEGQAGGLVGARRRGGLWRPALQASILNPAKVGWQKTYGRPLFLSLPRLEKEAVCEVFPNFAACCTLTTCTAVCQPPNTTLCRPKTKPPYSPPHTSRPLLPQQASPPAVLPLPSR